MKTILLHKFASEVGEYLKGCPPQPRRDISERISHLLWALERVEQRKLRREGIAYLRHGNNALR